jgi:hypothetical protein
MFIIAIATKSSIKLRSSSDPGVTPIPIIDPTTNVINNIIQKSIFNVAINAIYTSMCIASPWLKYPIINSIFKYILGYFGNYLYIFLAQDAVITTINVQTEQQLAAYSAASSELAVAIQSGGDTTIAQTKFQQALTGIVQFDGITNIK